MANNNSSIYSPSGLNDYGVTQEGSQSATESESGADEGKRKRKRPVNVTCEACKARKVKCDRQQPSCGWCTRNDHMCEYKERKKPGLRAGYGRELESKILRLEQLVHDQGRQLAAHLGTCSPSGTEPSSTGRPSYDASATAFQADAGFQQQVIDPKLRPSMSRNGSLQYPAHTQQSIAEQQFTQQGQYTPSAQTHPMTSPQSMAAFSSAQMFNEQAAMLPPYDLLYSLADIYFKHVNIWLPLLDRKTTMDRLFGASQLDEADRVLLHAIVAVSLRFSRDARLTAESRQQYHSTSKQRVQLFGLENSSVRSLQALVILALDVTGDTNGPPGWNLLALISRSVVQLGLSFEASSSMTAPMYPSIATLRASVLPEAKTWIEDEERRRLFWSVFLLDRYATIATAFEFALDEKEVDRRLPCRDDLFAGNKAVETRYYRPPDSPRYATSINENHGYISYHCELIGILGHIHQFLKRPIDIESVSDVEQWQTSYRMLDSELNAWHFSLPDEFANITRLIKSNMPAKNASCGWTMLHAAYYLTVIRLNSSAAYPSQTSAIFSSSYSAMQRCLSAVDGMRQLANFVAMSGLLEKLGPPFAFAVWVCARVTLVHGSTMDHEVDPDMSYFVTVLSEMGQYWEVARRYGEILQRVLSEYQQSQQSSSVTGQRITASTVRILADMRRCAYDLDFLISRQPHNSTRSYQATRQNTPAPNELEYLDVFDLFNFPRLPAAAGGAENGTGQSIPMVPDANLGAGMNTALIPNFAMPNPDADWLFHSR